MADERIACPYCGTFCGPGGHDCRATATKPSPSPQDNPWTWPDKTWEQQR